MYWVHMIYDYLFNYKKIQRKHLDICKNCMMPYGKHFDDNNCPSAISFTKLNKSGYDTIFVSRDDALNAKFEIDPKRTKLFLKLMKEINAKLVHEHTDYKSQEERILG